MVFVVVVIQCRRDTRKINKIPAMYLHVLLLLLLPGFDPDMPCHSANAYFSLS